MFVTGLDARREYLQMTEPFATCTYRSSLHLIGSVLHTLEVHEIEKLTLTSRCWTRYVGAIRMPSKWHAGPLLWLCRNN